MPTVLRNFRRLRSDVNGILENRFSNAPGPENDRDASGEEEVSPSGGSG